MIAFIDDHRAAHGVESICKVLQVAPSGYYARLAVRADPAKGSVRQQTDARLRPKIQKVWDDNWQWPLQNRSDPPAKFMENYG